MPVTEVNERSSLLDHKSTLNAAVVEIRSGQSSTNTSIHEDAVDDEAELSTSQILGILAGPWIGGFVVALDSTMIATIAAPISTSFMNLPLLGWLATSFFIASAVSQPLAGKLTDIYGRREGFYFTSVIFAFGNLICAFAGNEWVLIAGRIIAGLGGGAIGTIAVFIMSDLIPLRKRGIWAGVANICFGTGSGIGGPFGGWINDTIGWRAAFAIQVPITVLSVVAMMMSSAKTSPPHPSNARSKIARIDWTGSMLLVLALLFMLLGLNSGGNLLPWTHPLVIASLPLAIILTTAFITWEAKCAKEPMIHVELFSCRTVSAVCVNNWFSSMARFAFLFYGPIFLQIQGYSTAETGMRFIPESAAIALGSLSCGVLMRRSGRYYSLLVVANLLDVVAFALICTFTLTTPSWPPFVYLAIMGFAYGSMLTTTLVALIASVDQAQQSIATSASYIFRSTGSVLGITAASLVFQNVLRPRLRESLGGWEQGVELISKIEKDFSYVTKLPTDLQNQALQAYMLALRAVFILCFGMTVLALVAGLFIRRDHKLYATMSRRPSK